MSCDDKGVTICCHGDIGAFSVLFAVSNRAPDAASVGVEILKARTRVIFVAPEQHDNAAAGYRSRGFCGHHSEFRPLLCPRRALGTHRRGEERDGDFHDDRISVGNVAVAFEPHFLVGCAFVHAGQEHGAFVVAHGNHFPRAMALLRIAEIRRRPHFFALRIESCYGALRNSTAIFWNLEANHEEIAGPIWYFDDGIDRILASVRLWRPLPFRLAGVAIDNQNESFNVFAFFAAQCFPHNCVISIRELHSMHRMCIINLPFGFWRRVIQNRIWIAFCPDQHIHLLRRFDANYPLMYHHPAQKHTHEYHSIPNYPHPHISPHLSLSLSLCLFSFTPHPLPTHTALLHVSSSSFTEAHVLLLLLLITYRSLQSHTPCLSLSLSLSLSFICIVYT